MISCNIIVSHFHQILLVSTATAALGTRTPLFYLAHHILQEGLHQQEVFHDYDQDNANVALPTGCDFRGLPWPGMGHWSLCLWVYCRPGDIVGQKLSWGLMVFFSTVGTVVWGVNIYAR